MSIQPAAAKKPGLLRRMRHYRNIYLMLLPVIIFYILFHYVPMGCLAIAFENYKPAKGILGSDWVGLKNFRKFLTGIYAWRVIRNTLTLNLLLLLFGFPAPILLALMINEMRENWYKKTIQTVSYMPHFVALVVVCGLLREFCLTTGLINDIIAFFGGTRVNLLSSLDHYRTVYVVSNIWQNIGWNSIIYLSALSSVDASLHEAAAIDGAGRFRQMLSVTLPALVPIIAVQLIMRMGHIMGEGHQKTILLYNEMTWEVSDIVSSYVYRRGLKNNDYSFGAAVDLFNSLVNVIILCSANYFSKHVVKESLW